jgi:hypothetical protein
MLNINMLNAHMLNVGMLIIVMLRVRFLNAMQIVVYVYCECDIFPIVMKVVIMLKATMLIVVAP